MYICICRCVVHRTIIYIYPAGAYTHGISITNADSVGRGGCWPRTPGSPASASPSSSLPLPPHRRRAAALLRPPPAATPAAGLRPPPSAAATSGFRPPRPLQGRAKHKAKISSAWPPGVSRTTRPGPTNRGRGRGRRGRPAAAAAWREEAPSSSSSSS
jgi:hypothetical protein